MPRMLFLSALLAFSIGCSSPTSSGEDHLTWTFDGQTQRATDISIFDNGRAPDGRVFAWMAGAHCPSGAVLNIGLDSAFAIGTVSLGQNAVTFTPDAKTSESGSNNWVNTGGASSSLTIVTLTDRRMAGQFDFTMQPGMGTVFAGQPNKRLQGTFDVAREDRTIC